MRSRPLQHFEFQGLCGIELMWIRANDWGLVKWAVLCACVDGEICFCVFGLLEPVLGIKFTYVGVGEV